MPHLLLSQPHANKAIPFPQAHEQKHCLYTNGNYAFATFGSGQVTLIAGSDPNFTTVITFASAVHPTTRFAHLQPFKPILCQSARFSRLPSYVTSKAMAKGLKTPFLVRPRCAVCAFGDRMGPQDQH